jgi:hypothetical protein
MLRSIHRHTPDDVNLKIHPHKDVRARTKIITDNKEDNQLDATITVY